MISPRFFLTAVEEAGVRFFTGVPDSLLKDFCACVSACCPESQHQISTNEGSAVAMAMGHYLATGAPALVYMQNSGLGNAVNPLTSLASKQVYGIPMILMIGWRGEILSGGAQLADEPQHAHQGKITLEQLELLGIPTALLTPETSDQEAAALFHEIALKSVRLSCPVALVVRKGSFGSFKTPPPQESHALSRESVIHTIINSIPETSPVVSTTGMASRELYELRKAQPDAKHKDFLTVGGMGHAAQIAVGIARAKADLLVVCIDGDGAALMHTGALALSSGCPNLLHIVINNQAHDSVGGQPTPQERIDFCALGTALGYQHVASARDEPSLRQALQTLTAKTGSRFLEVHCKKGARENLGRPKETPEENKRRFMAFLANE